MNDTFPVIDGHTKLTGLLGSPVSHSISPLMHNEAFRLLDLNYVYLCFDGCAGSKPCRYGKGAAMYEHRRF